VKLAEKSRESVIQSLNTEGLRFKIGAFSVCLSSPIEEVADHLISLYGAFEAIDSDQFIDFYTALVLPSTIRRFIRPQVNFSFDGHFPFKPLPFQQASAMFEWGLNWCIVTYSHQFLIIHAAVAECNGQAFVFPGMPGSGKSTLCAALVASGWRLLSDEMTLLSIYDGLVYPVPRPISLKNQSIDLIRSLYPDMIMGQIINDTSKGTVVHMRPPDLSVHLGLNPARPTKLVFPQYQHQSSTKLVALNKGSALLKAVEQSFNYNVLGLKGFNCLSDLIDNCDCYDFTYSNLPEAIALFKELSL
jgi:HprK-related kinase A